MKLRSLEEADIKNKKVLIRCGFDVPFDENGDIVDDERIKECVPTFNYLLEKQAKLILMAHNGRPKGKVVKKLSMDKIGKRLEEILGKQIKKLDDCIGPQVEAEVASINQGDIIILENLRFHKEEKKNDEDFAKQLARLAEIYINEAFANAHRDHASMTGITKFLPAYAGFRLQKEIEVLSELMENPEHPFVAIIGGAKISDKIKVIKKFLETADHVLLGGALANTILQAQGVSIGKSLVEKGMADVANQLPLTNVHLHVPVDVMVADKIAENVDAEKKAVGNVSDEEYILDIGPDTIKLYDMVISKAKTVIWGGPMGYFEIGSFSKGSFEVAESICRSQAMSVVGGGDTLEVLDRVGCKESIKFISTGGGAMLEFLEGTQLPALKPLMI